MPLFWDIVFGALKQIGFAEEDFEYNPELIGDTVEFSCLVKNVPTGLSRLGMLPGDRIVVQTSRKPTLEEFESALKKFDAKIWLNSDGTYAIAVCRKN